MTTWKAEGIHENQVQKNKRQKKYLALRNRKFMVYWQQDWYERKGKYFWIISGPQVKNVREKITISKGQENEGCHDITLNFLCIKYLRMNKRITEAPYIHVRPIKRLVLS